MGDRADEAKVLHVEEDMLLPPGKTCSDCKNYERFCSWYLAGHITGQDKACDWSPSRFKEKPKNGE